MLKKQRIKYLQVDPILALNDPYGVDMQLKLNINNYDCNQTFINESKFDIE